MNRPRTSTLVGAATAAAALAFAVALPAAVSHGGRHQFRIVPVAPRLLEQPSTAVRARPDVLPAGIARVDSAVAVDGRRRLIVEAKPGELRVAKAAITATGGRIERTYGGLVQALLPTGSVTAVEAAPAVADVRPPMTMVEHAVSGEEVAASLAPAWHAKGFTGKGVKVAVVDGGFQGLAERQASGDLPANVVTQDFCGGKLATADDHGTAVAEIVHEMAPDAQLYLVCVETEVDLASAGAYVQAQGVHVVNHSAGWYGPSRDDGTGPIAAVVSAARAAGILWVNSAGNDAQTHWAGTFTSADGDMFLDFAPGDEGNSFVWPDDSAVCAVLKWDEWPAGLSDFDLALALAGSNQLVGMSAGDQTGSQPPFEGLCVYQTTGRTLSAYWAVAGYSMRSNPRLDLFTFGDYNLPLQYQTAAGSINMPASSPAALAVGASCWQSRQLEPYSSRGPTIDGRMKPDITGHDGMSGATYGAFSGCGTSGFSGTSASSPEVAGAAALVKQAFPAYTPDQIQQYLVRGALDMGAAGADNDTGAGELQLPKPPDVVAPTAKALAASGRAGTPVKLRSSVADDEGVLSVVEKVKRNGATVKTIKRPGTVRATSSTTVTTTWQAPKKLTGPYQHCVIATDAAGNKSSESCAKVTLRA